MAQTSPYSKKKYTLDAVSWTPIEAPFHCNSVVIRNLSTSINVKLRSDQTDAETEDSLPPGNQETIAGEIGPVQMQTGKYSVRFRAAAVVCYVQAESGSPDILATFII